MLVTKKTPERISQMSIEHIAFAAILNAAYLQMCRYEITNKPDLTLTFKQEFNGLKFATGRVLKFLKLEDNRWQPLQRLTDKEIETVQNNIILASAPIARFCRIASQVSSNEYQTLNEIVNTVEQGILEAIPEQHKQAFLNALKGI